MRDYTPLERIMDEISECKKALTGQESRMFRMPRTPEERNDLLKNLKNLEKAKNSADRVKRSSERPKTQCRTAYVWVHPEMIIYSRFGLPDRPKEDQDKFWKESGEILDEIAVSENMILLYASSYPYGGSIPLETRKKLELIPHNRRYALRRKREGSNEIENNYEKMKTYMEGVEDVIIFGGRVYRCIDAQIELFAMAAPLAKIYLSDKAIFY